MDDTNLWLRKRTDVNKELMWMIDNDDKKKDLLRSSPEY